MRKVRRLTQAEIANYIGISQNAYSYWESGKVKVDNESLSRLAKYYNVSLDFLSGRNYVVTLPVSRWEDSLQEDYHNGDSYLKQYLEYRYGEIVYTDDIVVQESKAVNSRPILHAVSESSGKQSDLESMLLHFFNKLSVEQKCEVIEFARKLSVPEP